MVAKLEFELSVAHPVKMYEVVMEVKNIFDEMKLQTKIRKYGRLKYTNITWKTSVYGSTVPDKVTHHVMVHRDNDKAFRTMLKQFDNGIKSMISYQQE